jgi:hypothetical protein
MRRRVRQLRGDVHDLCGRMPGRGRRRLAGPLHPPLPRLRGRLRQHPAHSQPADRARSHDAARGTGGLPGGVPSMCRRVRAPRAHHEHCRLCAEECRRCERACGILL